ncbi:porin family protein [Croceibacter atlanticus]|uniref:porin family protein n=1 Tax=Croceibacter atlanticus TaxID=313588 RepID=UPI002E137E84|nr:porin family protein [Croceibacter atlanticus]
MKKLFLFTAIAAFGFTSVQAQDGVSFGAKGGVNFAKLTGDDVEDADGRTSFHVGAIVEIPVSDRFSVQPEVLYSGQGLQSEEDGIESKIKLDYINVPVLAKFYLTDGLSLEGGPQFGFLVNDEFEIEDSNGNSIEVEDLDAASFDLGAALGLGYKFTNGLFLQGRYVLGLSNVDDSEEEGAFEDDLTNSTLQFSVGLQF